MNLFYFFFHSSKLKNFILDFQILDILIQKELKYNNNYKTISYLIMLIKRLKIIPSKYKSIKISCLYVITF